MRGKDAKPTEVYESTYESFSDDFRREVGEQVIDAVDAYLLLIGEPKDYRGVRHLSQAVADSIILWAVTEGFLTLPEAYVATDEEKAKRPQRPSVANALGDEAEAFLRGGPGGTGQYL